MSAELVGNYQTGILLCCRSCHSESKFVPETKEVGEENLAEKMIAKQPILRCDHCRGYDIYLQKFIQFTCPDCKGDNCLCLEPNQIIDGPDLKMITYHTEMAECIYCDHTFCLSLYAPEPQAPLQRGLFKLEEST